MVDVVVVAYNSRRHLRTCVEPLAGRDGVHVIVVDNASPDRSLAVVADLPVTKIRLDANRGFGSGCNAGWRAGEASAVLFLNPDARIEPEAIRMLAGVVDREPDVGAVAPRILAEDGSLEHSLRRFPRLRSRYAQALFLHRLFPRAHWVDEVVRDHRAYAEAGPAEWVSGACILVRRLALEELDGFDEGFFMYCEDVDLCKRLWAIGQKVRYEPSATAVHGGGGSAPRPSLLPVLAASRLRYAHKHFGPAERIAERAGIALGALTHTAVSQGGMAVRTGHARSLAVALGGSTSAHPA